MGHIGLAKGVQVTSANRRVRLVATLSAGLLVSAAALAACSSGTSSTEPASAAATAAASAAATAAAPSSAAPAELTPVNYVMPWVIQGEEAGEFAALNQGFFKDEGLDVTIVPGGPDVRAGALLESGSADFAVLNPAGVFTNRAEGIMTVGVGGLNQADGLLLMCKKSTGIDSFEKLKGKKIGVWLGGGEAGFQAAAVKAGLQVADVQWLPQKFSMDEFFNDAFDCASATEWNEKHVVYSNPDFKDGANLFELRPTDLGLYLPGDSIVTLQKTIDERPQLVQGIVNATLRGWQWVCSSPDNRKAGAQYTVDAAPDLDLALQVIQVEEMCNLMAQGPAKEEGMIGALPQASWQAAADAALAAGQLKAAADVATSYTATFLDQVPADYRKITW